MPDSHLPRLPYRVIDEGRYGLEDLERRDSVVAELFRLERNRRRGELRTGIGRVTEHLRSPEDASLRRAFLVWIYRVLLPGRNAEEDIPEVLELEEFRDMLEKRVQEWNRELREEGRREGLREGRRKGKQEGRQEGEAALLTRLLERKFGPLDAFTRARLRSADADQLLTWGERFVTAERLQDVFGE